MAAGCGTVRGADAAYDVLVIGAGVIGCAVARELSRWRLRVGVLERALEPGLGNSSRNSGVLHGGFTYKKGSLKAICCVEGNREFDRVAAELGVPFRRTGKVIVGFTEADMQSLLRFKAVGEGNGVRGLEMVDAARLRELDPSAGGEFAMHSPDSGILDPFAYTWALAENAAANGAEFLFGREVIGARREATWTLGDGAWILETTAGEYRAPWVVNAAGMQCARISSMLGIPGYTIRGFKGEYLVLDKKAGAHLNMPVYPAPNANGGFATHATPTVDGNVLIGPDSYVVEDFDDFGTTKVRLDGLVEDGLRMFAQVKPEYFIRTFAGIRAKRVDPATGEVLDFVVEARPEAPGTVNLVGIESPGLTSALPLARRAAALVVDGMRKESGRPEPNPDFDPTRKAPQRFSELDHRARAALVAADPDFGEVVCRCEGVTRAEILRAIRSAPGARTVAGVKNRTRATMGRCQGGYCETRITALLQAELGLDDEGILLGARDSRMFAGKVRE